MIELPAAFLEEIKRLLPKGEIDAYLSSYESAVKSGLRVNTLKLDPSQFAREAPFSLAPVPWASNAFYYEEKDDPTHHPWYAAGAYYVQEPSAMIPAQLLPVEPGDVVLDLCAAPGGKATELAARLKGQGFLLANDVSNSRAKALLRNLERFGVPNMAVCSEDSGKLASLLPETFTKILVDAPCSGEGMFHKEPRMVQDWLKQGPEHYAAIQRQIVLDAADMLAPGGMMLYSTCTFSQLEDEGTVAWLLEQRPEMSVVPVRRHQGFAAGLAPCQEAVRIWPHYVKGEGHFACLLQKKGNKPALLARKDNPAFWEGAPEELQLFLRGLRNLWFAQAGGSWRVIRDDVYFVPLVSLVEKKLRFLRTGLLVGTVKRGRFEPSQVLAMALRPQEAPCVLNMENNDDRVERYLRGETISADESLKGWTLVCVDGLPLGWGKAADGSLKNKLDAGWRRL